MNPRAPRGAVGLPRLEPETVVGLEPTALDRSATPAPRGFYDPWPLRRDAAWRGPFILRPSV